jgi:hypothetical protein
LIAGFPGSNPAKGLDVCLLYFYVVFSCVVRGLCDGLISRPEDSTVHLVVLLINFSTEEDKTQMWAVVPKGKKKVYKNVKI